jgi:hypothetical protein
MFSFLRLTGQKKREEVEDPVTEPFDAKDFERGDLKAA